MGRAGHNNGLRAFGIINIIDHARRATGVQDVAVIGGFHMVDYSAGKMKRTIEALRNGAAILMPCHCTGIEAMFALREGLGKCVQPGSAEWRSPSDWRVGKVLERKG
jgi:7,8-dihydropterin-6-yl-methyl-4-(beta-D-ribofuranosyl)aminobenzene 5'-phosphate synthase